MGGDLGRMIPVETVPAAWAASPSGTPAMWIRDRLAGVFTEENFVEWFPADGRRGLSPVVLALVSVLQFAENLTDRQAALAVRCRIDWKYCLGLELTDPGFDHSVLSEFRDRIAEGDRADRLLALLVERLVEAGLVKKRGRVRTDSTHMLAAVRKLNRVDSVTETLRMALEELAAADERWLACLITPEWARRYGRPARYERLPRDKDEVTAHVLQVGRDGTTVLQAVFTDAAPSRLRDLPGVEVLRQVWVQQYWTDQHGTLCWRTPKTSRDRQSRHGRPRRSAPPVMEGDDEGEAVIATTPWSGVEIVTPYDPEARYCRKEGKTTTTTKSEWIGYRDHQSETCDDDLPNVVVHVATRPAPVQDINTVNDIHAGLTASGLTPVEHLVDSGYITLLPRPVQEIQTRNRIDQHTDHWKARYALRAGCEATVSETTRAHGLRHCRYKGLAKTHVQHVLTAAGTNITRLADHYDPSSNPDRPPRPATPLQQLCKRVRASTTP